MSIKRVIFATFNSIFFVLGLAVLGVGIYSRVEYGNWKDIISGDVLSEASTILIAAGVSVALIGFFGCIGAWKKNATCLIAYAVFVILIFLLEIAAGIYAYVQKEDVQKQLETGINRAVEESYGKSDTAAWALTKAVDWFQKNVKCCGSARPNDWMTSNWFKALANNATIVPSSCCVTLTMGCNVIKNDTLLGNKIHTVGCIEQGKKFAKDNLRLICGVGVGIGVIELLGILCASLLCRKFQSTKFLFNQAREYHVGRKLVIHVNDELAPTEEHVTPFEEA